MTTNSWLVELLSDAPLWVKVAFAAAWLIAPALPNLARLVALWMRQRAERRRLDFAADVIDEHGVDALDELPAVLDAIRGDDTDDVEPDESPPAGGDPDGAG